MGFQVSDDGVFHVTLGLQYGIAVIDQQLLEQGVLQSNVALQPTVVEQVPLERTKQAPGLAGALEQIATLHGTGADASTDRQMRVELGHGITDLRTLGGELTLRTADIRASPDQILWHTKGYIDRRSRNACFFSEHSVEFLWGISQKERQSILDLLQGGLQRRGRGPGVV